MALLNKEINIKPITRTTMSKQVVEQVIYLLTSGQLKPGDRLPTEAELIEKLHISKPILREALSSLEMMGLIEKKSRDGTYFSNKIGSHPFSLMFALSSSDQPSIIEARMCIELGLIILAAENITVKQLEQLQANLDLMSVCPEEYGDLDREFHRIIAFSVGNPILEGMIDPLLSLFDQTYSQVAIDDRNWEETFKQHVAIYNALKNHDPIEAYATMYRHLSYGRAKMMKKMMNQL